MKIHLFPITFLLIATAITNSNAFSFLNGSGVSVCKLSTAGGKNLFGFSITVHTLTDDSKVILVGAPKAKIGYNQEGAVYSCKLGSNKGCQCTQLNVGDHNGTLTITAQNDPQIIPGDSFTYNNIDQFNAAKNGSLMGFSVTSDFEAGQAAACAPLHLIDNQPSGSCVGLSKDLNQTLFRAYPSASGVNGIFASGASVKIRKDSDNSYRIITGAPLDGRRNTLSIGSVDQIKYTDTNFDFSTLKSARTNNEDILRRGSISSYVGYAVGHGYFTEPKSTATQRDIIASAPRYNNHKGAVFAFSDSAVSPENFDTLTPKVIAMGDTIGSYFGYSMHVVKFNSSDDGYDEIIVGAPLHSTYAPLSPDRGQISVFRGVKSGGITEFSRVASYMGEANDRLGASITDLGDINLDGIPDIGVSGLNTPKIYIYLGTKNAEMVFSQYIDTSLYGFSGIYAMHGGVDFNGDGYPDIAFSDPSIEKVKVLAGSPLVRIEAEFELFTENGDLIAVNDKLDVTDPTCESTIEGPGIKVLCFKVRPCFNLASVITGQIDTFLVDFFIDLDSNYNGTQRVYFIDQGKQSRVEQRIELKTDERMCSVQNFTVYFVSNFGDISPVNIVLDIHDVPPMMQNIITDDDMFTTIVPALDRSREIIDNEGYANRDLLLKHPCSDGECNVDLALKLQPIALLNISEEIFQLDIHVTNNEDDVALQTFFSAQFPDNIEVVQRQLNATNELSGDSCSQTTRNQLCSLQPNPFMSTKGTGPVIISYTLKFTFEFPLHTPSIAFQFNISSPKSIDEDSSNNQITPVIKLNATADLFFQITSNPKDRITLREHDEGGYADTNLQVTFRVGNRGPTWVSRDTMKMMIFWPLCIRGFCNLDPDAKDAINLEVTSISYITQSFSCENPRTLADTVQNVTFPSEDSPSFKSYQICNQSAICTPILCTVQLLRAESNSYITLSSKLKLGSDVQIQNSLSIQPSAYLETPTIPIVTLSTSTGKDATSISQKIYIFPEATLEQCIMIFPIIAGVIAGIVFILIIGLIVWFIQFTGRERYTVVKRRRKLEGSRSVTPSTTGQFQTIQLRENSPTHGTETSQV